MNNINKFEFIKMILNDEYILWLSSFIIKHIEFDDVYFTHNNRLSDNDLLMINYLGYLYLELNAYNIKNNINYDIEYRYYFKYKDLIYVIEFDGECYSCRICNKLSTEVNYIEYEDLKLHEVQICSEVKQKHLSR